MGSGMTLDGGGELALFDRTSAATGLPKDFAQLLQLHPRDSWQGHHNFSELTRFWLDRHESFRQVFTKLNKLSEAYLSAPSDSFAQKTVRYTSFLLQQLEGHHQIEDQHYFPQISVLDSRAEKGFAMLDSDHDALHHLIEGTVSVTNNALTAIQNGIDARGAVEVLRKHQLNFQSQLLRHLSDEEELVVPVILEHGFVG